MTREVFTPSPIYTISGTGPYTIQHPYQVASEIRATIFQGVNIIDLAPANFTVSPGSSATTGDVTITSAIATMYAGASLVIRRVTVADQGWAGQTAREKGLEAQLDALTQRMQEVDEAIGRAIKVPDGAVAELPLDLASSFPFFDAGGNLVLASGLVTGVPVTPYMVSLLDDVDALTARGTLGLRIGTDVQAYSAVLSSTTASFTTAMLTNLNNQSGINTGDEPNATESAYGVTLQATYTDAIAGTQNTKYMTPLRTAQAITALTPPPPPGLGVGQTWSSPVRSNNVAYQNTTGRPIFVVISVYTNRQVYVSADAVTWVTLCSVGANPSESGTGFVVPNGYFYKTNGKRTWGELR